MEIGRPTEIVYSSRKAIIRTIFAVLIGMLGVLGVMAVVGLTSIQRGATLAEWSIPALMMVGMFFFAVIALAAGGFYAHNTEAANIRRVLDGPHWAAWQYNPSEWYAFAEQTRQAMEASINKSIWWLINMILLLGLTVFIVGGLMAWLLFGIPPESRAVIAPMLLIIPILGGLALIFIVVSSLSAKGHMRRVAEQQYAAMRRVSSPRMYFTGKGLYREDSGYASLEYLVEAEYLAQSSPPAIRLKSWQRSGRSLHQTNMIMPVPQGCEHMAAQLIERYRRERLGQ